MVELKLCVDYWPFNLVIKTTP